MDFRHFLGFVIGQLTAVDRDVTERNNEIMYVIQEGGTGKFTIGLKTGSLSSLPLFLRSIFSPRSSLSQTGFQKLLIQIVRFFWNFRFTLSRLAMRTKRLASYCDRLRYLLRIHHFRIPLCHICCLRIFDEKFFWYDFKNRRNSR